MVDRFSSQESTPEMFEHEHGPTPWSVQTKLSSILSKFLDGDEMKSRLFPARWLVEFSWKKGLHKDTHGLGVPSCSGYQITCEIYQEYNGGGQGSGNYSYQEGVEVARRGPSCLLN